MGIWRLPQHIAVWQIRCRCGFAKRWLDEESLAQCQNGVPCSQWQPALSCLDTLLLRLHNLRGAQLITIYQAWLHVSITAPRDRGLVIDSWQPKHLFRCKRLWTPRIIQFVSFGALLLHLGPINVNAPVIRSPINHASLSSVAAVESAVLEASVTRDTSIDVHKA